MISKEVTMGLITKIAKKVYRSSKTFKKKMQQLNRRLGRFKEQNVSANDANMYMKMIKQFNERNGIEGEELDTNRWYTKDQQKEIRNIINAANANPETSLNYWKETFKKVKELGLNEDKNVNLNFFKKVDEKFGFDNMQEFINFTDNMKRFAQSANIKDILTSEQYQDLVEIADETGYSEEFEIDDLIISEWKKTGKTFESLYNHVFDILMNYQKYGVAAPDVEEEDE